MSPDSPPAPARDRQSDVSVHPPDRQSDVSVHLPTDVSVDPPVRQSDVCVDLAILRGVLGAGVSWVERPERDIVQALSYGSLGAGE